MSQVHLAGLQPPRAAHKAPSLHADLSVSLRHVQHITLYSSLCAPSTERAACCHTLTGTHTRVLRKPGQALAGCSGVLQPSMAHNSRAKPARVRLVGTSGTVRCTARTLPSWTCHAPLGLVVSHSGKGIPSPAALHDYRYPGLPLRHVAVSGDAVESCGCLLCRVHAGGLASKHYGAAAPGCPSTSTTAKGAHSYL